MAESTSSRGRGRGRGSTARSDQPIIPTPAIPIPQSFATDRSVEPSTVPRTETTESKPQSSRTPATTAQPAVLCAEAKARNEVLTRYASAGWTIWTAPKGRVCSFVAINGARCHCVYVVHATSDIQLNNNPQITPNITENGLIQHAAQNGAQPVLCAVTSRARRTGEPEINVIARIAGSVQPAIIGGSGSRG